jgi:hypothetical protein
MNRVHVPLSLAWFEKRFDDLRWRQLHNTHIPTFGVCRFPSQSSSRQMLGR